MIYAKFYYSLNVTFNNKLDESKLFIESLEHNLKKFISSSTKLNNKYINDKSKKESNIRYIPEKMTLSSPLTLFEGPKFSGKTTFIEYICKNILDNKIKLSYINKVKVINLLNYCPCFDPNVFFNLFINDILDVLDNNETKKSLHKYLSMSSEKNDSYKLNINLDIITKINKQINKPILFIIDNVEKIGTNVEVIIQAINRLSIINNFAFLFIVNGNFNKFIIDYSNEKEKSISKSYKKLEDFVNLPIYKFNQDYTCLLNKYNLDSELIKNLNDILVTNNDYSVSLKELDTLLTSIVQNDNHLDKYKFLNSLYNTLPNVKDRISNIIEENNKLFHKSLKDFRELIECYLQICKDFLDKHSYLDNLIGINNDNYYWENSKIKYELERKFQGIFSKCYDDKKWIKYRDELLDVSKTIETLIKDISLEIESNKKRISTSKVLKIKKNKINDEYLYSPTFSDMDETNYEITSSENLIDELVIGDPDEINNIKEKITSDNVILNNLEVIKKNLNLYFSNIENNTNDLPNKIKQFLGDKNFKDDINVLNKIFSDTKFKNKLLENSSSYEELLKFKSLEAVLNDNDLQFFDELISFVDNEMRYYIMDNYNKPY